MGRCIPDRIHKGNRYKLFLKVHCHWIISFSKDSRLTEQVKASNFADENDSLLSSRQLKYNNSCASPGLFSSDSSSPFSALLSVSGGPWPAGCFPDSHVSWCPGQPVGDKAGVGSTRKEKPEYFSPFSPPQVASLTEAASPVSLAPTNSTPLVPASTR